MALKLFSAALLVLLQASQFGVLALDNGLARTPPMGWSPGERFACNVDCATDPHNCISEQLYMEMADRLLEDGFRDVGYEFVVVDDCWASKERDSNGKLQADPMRFPNGIKKLADYVHSKGLKLGIYADLGTCGGYPGTLGHIDTDAQTFADWGIDMLKLDGCNVSPADYETGYPSMSKALIATGRSIVFSCSWPTYVQNPDYEKIAENCNVWHNDSFHPDWQSVLSMIDSYKKNQDLFLPVAGPGQWNDPGMLVVGNSGLSLNQQKAQMVLWAIFAAPLLMSNDLRDLRHKSKEILLNKDVIAINQDQLRKPGRHITSHGSQYLFARLLDGGEVAVAVLNRHDGPTSMEVVFENVGLHSSNTNVQVIDVMEPKSLGTFTGDGFFADMNSFGARLFRLTPENCSPE